MKLFRSKNSRIQKETDDLVRKSTECRALAEAFVNELKAGGKYHKWLTEDYEKRAIEFVVRKNSIKLKKVETGQVALNEKGCIFDEKCGDSENFSDKMFIDSFQRFVEEQIALSCPEIEMKKGYYISAD